jgi:cysteine desulfurase family protein
LRRDVIYLDNAATTWPKPERVYKAMQEFALRYGANPGRSGHRMAVEAEQLIYAVRSKLARFINAEDPSCIVFTLNCTDALNVAIKGVLRNGDHVITTCMEHNSVERPLCRLQNKGIIELTRVAPINGIVPPDDIVQAIRPNTRLIVTTHASNVIGKINPVEQYGRLARSKGVILLVDAGQTMGVVKIDVEHSCIDMLAFPGHKGLFGPTGTGGLYVRKGLDLEPFREGGTGFASEFMLQPEQMPYHLEGGTPNSFGIAGLGAGIEFIEDQGIDKILAHERELMVKFIEGIQGNSRITLYGADDLDRQLGLISLTIKDMDPMEVGAILDHSFGIACRTGLHCSPAVHKLLGTFPQGSIRFSFGYFNTEEDVEELIRAINEITS